jgi:hypothetical protein
MCEQRTRSYEQNSSLGERAAAAVGIDKLRISTIDDNISGLQMLKLKVSAKTSNQIKEVDESNIRSKENVEPRA